MTKEQRTFSGTDTTDECINISTTEDTILEDDETFTVTLSVDSPQSERVIVMSGGSRTTVTILDNTGRITIEAIHALVHYTITPCLAVTVQMRDGQLAIAEGGTVSVCAEINGVLERNVIVSMETSQTGSAEATGEF